MSTTPGPWGFKRLDTETDPPTGAAYVQAMSETAESLIPGDTVSNFSELQTKYPNPVIGMKVFVLGEDETYTYRGGTKWEPLQQFKSVSGRLDLPGWTGARTDPAGGMKMLAGTVPVRCYADTSPYRVDFPSAFSTEVVTVVVSNGQRNLSQHICSVYNFSPADTSGFSVRCYYIDQSTSGDSSRKGVQFNNQWVRLNYIAMGY